LRDVPVQFEGESGAGTLDFLINSSEATDEGILAPQDVVRPGWALVIDLGREELRYESEQTALKRLREEGSAPLREVDFHRCLYEGFFERSHRIVSATINGVSVSMLVDTGASRTVLARNNPALRSMLALQGDRETSHALTSTGQTLLVDAVPIVFSQTSFVVPVSVQPAPHMCGQGLLGADVLSHCTIVWGWSSLWSACRG
jgi:gag-polyprotein putative aspartyl protease